MFGMGWGGVRVCLFIDFFLEFVGCGGGNGMGRGGKVGGEG